VQTLGQWSVFEKVANSFCNQYQSLRLEQLPPQQRAKEAHSLKGIRANVGALRLQELAAAYESEPDQQALSQLQEELDCVLKELAKVLGMQRLGAEKEDDARLEQLWQQLPEALETKRPHRIQPVVNELQRLQMDAKRQEIFDTIKQYVTAYKFKEALELLR
jgi:HPt (histidine-containing phosphotransfer) domain-containing protein